MHSNYFLTILFFLVCLSSIQGMLKKFQRQNPQNQTTNKEVEPWQTELPIWKTRTTSDKLDQGIIFPKLYEEVKNIYHQESITLDVNKAENYKSAIAQLAEVKKEKSGIKYPVLQKGNARLHLTPIFEQLVILAAKNVPFNSSEKSYQSKLKQFREIFDEYKAMSGLNYNSKQ